jgi:hypothetical protein
MVEAAQKEAVAERLSSWTRITAGATRGGPELVRIGDDIWLIATGGDGVVQAGRLDLNTKQIEPSTWVALTEPVSNDAVSCVPISDDQVERTVRCAALVQGGAVATFDIQVETAGIKVSSPISAPIGSNAGGRPAIEFNAWNNSWYTGYSQETGPQRVMPVVWAGGDRIWLKNMNPTSGQGWQTYQVPGLASPVSCAWNKCVYRMASGAVGTFRLWTDLWDQPPQMNLWDTKISRTFINTPLPDTPPLPKATGTPEIATESFYTSASTIVMTDTAGTVWSIKGDNKKGQQSWTEWTSLAGANRKGSAPSCVLHSTSLVCAIQASDGSIYMRQVGASGGL